MSAASPFESAAHYQPLEVNEYRGARLPARFGQVAEEYGAARESAALFDRSDRGLLIARGDDRKTWLHALVTNAVKTLDDDSGNYAFAIDQRGRILFDLNILASREALWLDIDLQALPPARAHLERYLIIEDVQLHDASAEWARLGVSGPRAADIAAELGATHFPAMPALAGFTLSDGVTRLVRHDFAGVPGFELFMPREQAAGAWDRLVETHRVTPAGLAALDVLRIEHGIPWLGRDLDDQVVAPESGQVERAISYHKGCYLGQEILERMRSHGSQARRLARVECDDGAGVSLPAGLRQGERDAGRLTSLVRHPARDVWVGLAYVRTGVAPDQKITRADSGRVIRVN